MNETAVPTLQGHQLLHNLILFGRVLRGLGVDVNPGRIMQVVQALEHVQIGRKSDFYYTLRSLLINHREDIQKFDEAFDLFWQKPPDGEMDIALQEMLGFHNEPETPDTLVAPPPLIQEEQIAEEEAADEVEDEEAPELIELTQTYSAREALREKDFTNLTAAELSDIKLLMGQLIWQLGQRTTRRRKYGRGRELAIRRSVRRNFRYGGELLEWSTRTQKVKPRPLVIIADISGSMERYTRLLIHFLYSLAEGLEQRVEVFTFSTRLTRITRQLRHRNVEKALEEVSQMVADWSGGTRIGDALKKFNFEWSRRVLSSNAIVVLISDGWDRGDPALLKHEMARLSRTCHRLVWLNPLLGSAEYEPLTRGMQAALPYIDDFLPVHNLASLEDLALHLQQLDEDRPLRRKRITLSGAAFVDGR